MSKVQCHVRYRDSGDNIVPGVTTILGVLSKPALVPWANKLGLQGIEVGKYVDNLAEIGTLAHAMIESYLRGEQADTSDYSANQIELAENALLSFWEWLKGKELVPLLLEEPLVSDEKCYGGTIDCYCMLDGVPTLLDFKTGKAIYPEMMYQLASYRELLGEYGYRVDQCRILRIGRDDTEGFEEKIANSLSLELEVFNHCLGIYHLQKKIRKGE